MEALTARLPVWLRLPPLRRLVLAALASAAVLVALVVGLNTYVLLAQGGPATSEISEVPHAQAAIVLGARVNSDGQMSSMLGDRIDRARDLYQAGKVDRILVSGDHGTWADDEPATMRRALLADGVPPAVIFEDHAGSNTWATMKRAREIFGVESAVVVTQQFHMPRSLYLADAAGLEASGLYADEHHYGMQLWISRAREVLSRVKAVVDATADVSVTGGPKIPITGDGRRSWGPQHPAGD